MFILVTLLSFVFVDQGPEKFLNDPFHLLDKIFNYGMLLLTYMPFLRGNELYVVGFLGAIYCYFERVVSVRFERQLGIG